MIRQPFTKSTGGDTQYDYARSGTKSHFLEEKLARLEDGNYALHMHLE